MKTNHLIYLCLMILLALPISGVQAQVTVGSDKAPAQAALLQLKDKEPDITTAEGNTTGIKGGLVLSRVKLVSIDSLEPFIDPNEITATEYEEQKLLHIGLMVYNIVPVGADIIPGVYVWDGQQWGLSKGGAMVACVADGGRDTDCDGFNDEWEQDNGYDPSNPCSPAASNLQVSAVVDGSKTELTGTPFSVKQGKTIALVVEGINIKKVKWYESPVDNTSYQTFSTQPSPSFSKGDNLGTYFYKAEINNCTEFSNVKEGVINFEKDYCLIAVDRSRQNLQMTDSGNERINAITIRGNSPLEVTVLENSLTSGDPTDWANTRLKRTPNGDNTEWVIESHLEHTYDTPGYMHIQVAIEPTAAATHGCINVKDIYITWGTPLPPSCSMYITDSGFASPFTNYSILQADGTRYNEGYMDVKVQVDANIAYASSTGFFIRYFGAGANVPMPSSPKGWIMKPAELADYNEVDGVTDGMARIEGLQEGSFTKRAWIIPYVKTHDGYYYCGEAEYLSACEYLGTDIYAPASKLYKVNGKNVSRKYKIYQNNTDTYKYNAWDVAIYPQRDLGKEDPNEGYDGGIYRISNLFDVQGTTSPAILYAYRMKWYMSQNLNYTTNLTFGTHYLYPGNDVANVDKKFGLLYTIGVARTACPNGWTCAAPNPDIFNTMRYFIEQTYSVHTSVYPNYYGEAFSAKSPIAEHTEWNSHPSGLPNLFGISYLPTGDEDYSTFGTKASFWGIQPGYTYEVTISSAGVYTQTSTGTKVLPIRCVRRFY